MKSCFNCPMNHVISQKFTENHQYSEVHQYNDLSFASELIFNDESYGILKTRQMEIALFINIWWGEQWRVERETLRDDNASVL